MSVYKPDQSPYFHYDFQRKGRRFHGSTGLKTKRAAEQFEDKLKREVALGKDAKPPITVDEACGTWWANKGHRQRAAKTYRYQLDNLIAGLGANRMLSDIGFSQLDDYIAARRSAVSDTSVNRETELYRRVWRYIKAKGFEVAAEEPEWGNLLLAEPKGRIRELKADEETRLFEKLPEDLAAVVEFAMLSGQRRTAVIRLRWKDVDFAARSATITLKAEADEKHTFPLTPRMIAILANRPKVGPMVFTYVCERPAPPRQDRPARIKGHRYPFSLQGWTRKWRKALDDAGIEDFKFHDLRHTAATRIVRATGNLKVAQQLLAHKTIQTTTRYAHATADDVMNAMILAEKRPECAIELDVIQEAKA